MAVNPKAVATWGLLGEAAGVFTQIIDEMTVTVSAATPLSVELEAGSGSPPLTVDLEAAEIRVELSDEP
jgi:hypothetical protein